MANEILNDKRFAIITTDPKFKKIHKHERKVKIDKRFRSMFTDKKFKVKYTVDKRGRPIHKSNAEDLKKYYDLESESDDDVNHDDTLEKHKDDNSREDQNNFHQQLGDESSRSENDQTNSDEIENDHDDSDEIKKKNMDNNVKCSIKKDNIFSKESFKNKKLSLKNDSSKKLKDLSIDYARGERELFSESSSDETESEESDSELLEHNWGELDNDAEQADNISSRLAVCNMDWDRIRAEDLMILFNSFLPTGGSIKSLAIYPSDFGIQRMKMEDRNGPTELVSSDKTDVVSDSDSDRNDQAEEGEAYHVERLRQYQLNRLKYYYAVVVFDSPETADHVYKLCDNLEYESSASRLDLRFVPDDVIFDQQPKEICDRLPDLSKYKPRYFVTTALQQAKVQLTWDETDPRRSEFVQKISEAVKIGNIDDSDIENYVALSSSEDENAQSNDEDSSSRENNEEDENSAEDSIARYRKLLKDLDESKIGKDEKDVQLQITWGAGDDDPAAGASRKEVILPETSNNSNLTPFQKLIEKRKEKKKERKKLIKKKKSALIKDNNEDYSSDEIHFDTDEESEKKNDNDSSHSGEDEEQEKTNQDELELLLMDENEESHKQHHFSLKKIKEKEATRRKRKRKEKLKQTALQPGADDFQINVTDERFEALYTSHLFNIDPTDPKFYKTKSMEAFIAEKQRRLANAQNTLITPDDSADKKKLKLSENARSELSALVKSVKNKTEGGNHKNWTKVKKNRV